MENIKFNDASKFISNIILNIPNQLVVLITSRNDKIDMFRRMVLDKIPTDQNIVDRVMRDRIILVNNSRLSIKPYSGFPYNCRGLLINTAILDMGILDIRTAEIYMRQLIRAGNNLYFVEEGHKQIL